MVRRTNVAKKKERVHLSETINPSAEEVELPPENTNTLVEGAEPQPANGNNLGRVEPEPKMETNSGFVSVLRKGKQTVSSVRRSVRLQGMVMPAHNRDIEQVIQEIALSGSDEDKEEEEEEPPAYEETEQCGPTMGNLEEKIDYLVRLLEEQQDRSSSGGSPYQSHSRYKMLYIDSQKKIEALSVENHQLALKLENALGKLEYEKGPHAYSKVLDKFQDVLIFSCMSSVAERAANVAAQTVPDAYTSQDAGREANISSPKRRKLDRERRNN